MSSPEPQRVTALVPMKGHSERIPRKNVRELCGRPLCCWILETLRGVEAVGKIVVNTDSEAIADLVSDRFGAVVHHRPRELRGDFVSMNRIIENDLERLKEGEHFLQTHATNPLVSAETLRRAVERYLEKLGERDSLFSVTRHQARFYDADGRPVNHDPASLERTQDLPPLYEENSNFYLFSRASFSTRGDRIGAHPGTFEVSATQAVDIDEPEDWRLAEALLCGGSG